MPRANLGQLLGNVDDSAPPVGSYAPKPVGSHAPKPAASAPIEAPVVDRESSATVAPVRDDQVSSAAYLRFVRKDTRLREDQLEALTSHARRLNRRRHTSGPRVTENTLIRVAVDLLLDRIEKACGDDEVALLKSIRR